MRLLRGPRIDHPWRGWLLCALVEPMAVACHAANIFEIQSGQLAVIAELGPSGVRLFFALRARGVTNIVIPRVASPP